MICIEFYEGDNSYVLNRLNEIDANGDCFLAQVIEDSSNPNIFAIMLDLGVEINYKNEFKLMKVAIDKGKKF